VLRLVVGATARCVVLGALFGVRPEDASSRSLLGGAVSCPGADVRAASEAAERRAVVCLLNVARERARRARLATAPKLRKAAAHKGQVVVSCGQLSHTPCGTGPTESLRHAGYQYSWFGENLWLGTWGHFTPRQVVDSWLGSPAHRANILRSGFRHFGVARVRANGVFGEPTTAIWVATFASPLE
jgi:uncharacterized protein YkwD